MLETLNEEARLAEIHGIDAFAFNFYHDGYRSQLEQPLLGFTKIQTRVKFALNICCRMPRTKLPFGLDCVTTEPPTFIPFINFREIARTVFDKYIAHPRYLRSGGEHVLSFYSVESYLGLYGIEGLTARLDCLRTLAAAKNVKLHLVGLFSVVGAWYAAGDLNRLPFDSFSCYVALPDFRSSQPVQKYEVLAEHWLTMWDNGMRGTNKPLHPCVTAGWDSTPRGAKGYNPNVHGLKFPYFPVVVGSTPEAFESYLHSILGLKKAIKKSNGELIFLGPLNEWSEGCTLLPDSIYGNRRLEVVGKMKHKSITL